MKTKSLFITLFITLIISSISLSQDIDNEIFNTKKPIIASDSSGNKPYVTIADSTYMIGIKDTISVDSTIKTKKKKKSFISSKVESSADDSTIYSADGQKVFLFGNAKITYEDIELTAAYIEIDMDQGIMYAEGTKDSLGKVVGQPVFKQGKEEMKAKTLTYNINNEKGYIEELYTQQQDGYLHSERTKKNPDNSIDMIRGKYTTCDLEHPHFYISLTKGRVIPNKVIVAGPSYMVIEDIPLPFFIPFGFFPSTQKRASGFIIPKFGEEKTRGFYLTDGGYYFALNDYMDLTVRGSIYSKGSWLAGAKSSYKIRYKFTGSFDIGYSKVIAGEPGVTGYSESNQYYVRWSHQQDAKARPNSNFSANVNFQSSNNNKYNSTTSQDYLNNQLNSSISYRKTFANTPFSASMNLNHSQSNRDSSISLTLPQVTLTMVRIQPFKSKKSMGKTRWYEDIGFSYSANFQNKVKTHIDSLFTSQTRDKFQKGVQHSPTISKSFKLLKYINLSPSVTYGERWYFDRFHYDRINDTTPISAKHYKIREEKGFYRVYDYSYGAGFNTTMYGMYQYKRGPIKVIRHVVTPSVSYSWRPDFSQQKFGYYEVDPTDSTGKRLYSPYKNGIYGVPGQGKSGSMSFSLSNNLEMKVKNEKDTVSGEKKIVLLESLNFGTSYNMLADSMNWSPLSVSARTTLFKVLSINFDASGDFYGLDKNGNRINKYNNQVTGKPIRFTRAGLSTGFNIDSKTFSGESKKQDNETNEASENPNQPPVDQELGDLSEYDYFKIPWSLRVDYSFDYSKSGFSTEITQTLGFSGDFSLTPKWKIGFRSNYDFKAKQFSYTQFNLSRDLHCWAASLQFVPFGPRQSYSFNIAVKSSILQDLKYDKHRTWMDN